MGKSEISNHDYAVIVAGGSGTRLWPMSRKEIPKQMQPLVSNQSLLEDTAERLEKAYTPDHIFVSTSSNYAEKIKKLLPQIPAENIIVEPSARGPALAFALFSETIRRRDPEAVILSLASDHAVVNVDEFNKAVASARTFVAEHDKSVALIGVSPTKPDTGLGYVKVDKLLRKDPAVYSVEKFVEKPGLRVAEQYVKSGDYYWNAAYYCFKASTLVEAYDEASHPSMQNIRQYLDCGDEKYFEQAPAMVHEIEIINAARFPLVLVPALFQWSDIGNWGTLHELLASTGDSPSQVVNSAKHHIDVDSEGCMITATNDQKLVATVGLKDIIIVDTEDSLLVMHKDYNQDIKQVIEQLKKRGLDKYL